MKELTKHKKIIIVLIDFLGYYQFLAWFYFYFVMDIIPKNRFKEISKKLSEINEVSLCFQISR